METSESKELQKRPPVTPTEPPTNAPQYVTGFEGMATQPFNEMTIKILNAPIPRDQVETKPDGIVYLPGVFYRQRLTEAFGPGGWSLAPRGPARVMGNVVTYHGALYALGRFISEAVGENAFHANNENMSYASALEGARTDCITRCCKDLLIAKELWDPGWRAAWQQEWVLRAWLKPEELGGRAQRGKWFYWRKDREVPWQVSKAQKRGQRIAGPIREDDESEGESPKGESGGGQPRTAANTATRSTGARPTTDTASATATHSTHDTGEAASEQDLDDLQDLVKAIGWKKPFILSFCKQRFGVSTPEAMTKRQVGDFSALMLAWRQGKEAFAAKMTELENANRVLKADV